MYTQCPDCQTRFRVTADALRTAHGTVRCGRCGSAFDALARLSDALPRPEPEVAPLPLLLAAEDELATFDEPTPEQAMEPGLDPDLEPSAESTIVLVDEGGAGEDITLEGERVSIEGEPEAPEEVYDLDATDEFEVVRIPSSAYPDEQEAERELEALIERLQREFGPMTTVPPPAQDARDDTTAEMPAFLEPETIEPVASDLQPAPEEPVHMLASDEGAVPPEPRDAESASEPAPASIVSAEVVPPQPSAPSPVSVGKPAFIPVEERPLSARRWKPEPAEFEQDTVPDRSGWRTFAWTLGSLLLALLLAGQVAHHYRHELLTDARIGPPMRAAYERLGVALPPTADLAALELRQWGDDAREAGRLVVHATLTNRAGFEQPYPVLRLQFEDRFGSLIATRDFEPADYLKDPAQAGRVMAPGASSEAELALVDPGADAVGYRLDLCLRESDAVLRCDRKD